MKQKNIIYGHDISERDLFLYLNLIALLIVGVGLVFILGIILVYIWPAINGA